MKPSFHVAIVDDDPRLRKLIAEELTDEGVIPLPCETGLSLLELMES